MVWFHFGSRLYFRLSISVSSMLMMIPFRRLSRFLCDDHAPALRGRRAIENQHHIHEIEGEFPLGFWRFCREVRFNRVPVGSFVGIVYTLTVNLSTPVSFEAPSKSGYFAGIEHYILHRAGQIYCELCAKIMP